MILIASATSLGWRIDQSTSGSPTWRILLARGPTTERGLVGSTPTSIDDLSSIRPGNATEIKKECEPRLRGCRHCDFELDPWPAHRLYDIGKFRVTIALLLRGFCDRSYAQPDEQ